MVRHGEQVAHSGEDPETVHLAAIGFSSIGSRDRGVAFQVNGGVVVVPANQGVTRALDLGAIRQRQVLVGTYAVAVRCVCIAVIRARNGAVRLPFAVDARIEDEVQRQRIHDHGDHCGAIACNRSDDVALNACGPVCHCLKTVDGEGSDAVPGKGAIRIVAVLVAIEERETICQAHVLITAPINAGEAECRAIHLVVLSVCHLGSIVGVSDLIGFACDALALQLLPDLQVTVAVDLVIVQREFGI